MQTPRTIKQRTVTVSLPEGGEIAVRRMLWPDARDFLALLAKHMGDLGTSMADVLTRLPMVVQSSTELIERLVLASTDLSREQLAQLDIVTLGEVLDAACRLNLGPELKNSCAGITQTLTQLLAGRVGGAAGVALGAIRTTPGATSTPPSSMPDSPPNT